MSNTLTDGEEEKVVFCSRSSVSPQPGSALRFTAGRFSVFSPFFSAVCVCASLAGLSDTSAPNCRTRQPGETTPCCSSFLPLKFLFLGRLCRHLLRWDVPRPHSVSLGGSGLSPRSYSHQQESPVEGCAPLAAGGVTHRWEGRMGEETTRSRRSREEQVNRREVELSSASSWRINIKAASAVTLCARSHQLSHWQRLNCRRHTFSHQSNWSLLSCNRWFSQNVTLLQIGSEYRAGLLRRIRSNTKILMFVIVYGFLNRSDGLVPFLFPVLSCICAPFTHHHNHRKAAIERFQVVLLEKK